MEFQPAFCPGGPTLAQRTKRRWPTGGPTDLPLVASRWPGTSGLLSGCQYVQVTQSVDVSLTTIIHYCPPCDHMIRFQPIKFTELSIYNAS